MNLRLTFVFLLASASFTVRLAGSESRPNIVLIFTDDQGIHDVGCYGSEIPTPHIDSLAREGLKFNSWYSASSICTPSRYGLLTGRNPCRSRDQLLGALMFLSDDDRNRGIRADETTLASRLRQAGYRTALIGKWHLGHGDLHFWPTRHGFDLFHGHTGGCVDFFTMRYGNTPDWYHNEEPLDVSGYATDRLTDEAVGYLKAQETDQPFFLYLAYNAPHFGKGWNDGAQTTVNQLQPPPFALRRVTSIADITRRKFAAKVVNLDDGIGRVLQTIEQQGLADNTLVIFLTDHGGDPVYGGANHPFRGGKATLFEGGIRVPCLIRWPAQIKARGECDAVVSSLDLVPTLCRLSEVEVQNEMDGTDISPLLKNPTSSGSPRELYWELGRHDELDRRQWRAIRQGPWKYVQDDRGREYLFDIANDPREQRNICRDHAQLCEELRKRGDVLSAKYAGVGSSR